MNSLLMIASLVTNRPELARIVWIQIDTKSNLGAAWIRTHDFQICSRTFYHWTMHSQFSMFLNFLIWRVLLVFKLIGFKTCYFAYMYIRLTATDEKRNNYNNQTIILMIERNSYSSGSSFRIVVYVFQIILTIGIQPVCNANESDHFRLF